MHSQPWYECLEGLKHLLPDDEARDRLAGESWPLRLARSADRCLEVLHVEQAKFSDDMADAQQAFALGMKDMGTVGPRLHECSSDTDTDLLHECKHL